MSSKSSFTLLALALFTAVLIVFVVANRSEPIEADPATATDEKTQEPLVSVDAGAAEDKSGDPAITGAQRSELSISHDGRVWTPSSNTLGIYERVEVKAQQPIKVRQNFPDLSPGASVRVLAMDGGFFENGSNALVIALNRNQEIEWNFEAAQHPGLYRVMLETPQQREVFEFWVGPEAPVMDRHGTGS